MDNNNTPIAPQPPPVNTPAEPTVPQVQTPESSPGSKKMIIMFVIGLVTVIVLVAGIYFFLSNQQTPAETANTIAKQPVTQATPAPPETLDALDRDINEVKVEDTDADFSEVDQDMQQL